MGIGFKKIFLLIVCTSLPVYTLDIFPQNLQCKTPLLVSFKGGLEPTTIRKKEFRKNLDGIHTVEFKDKDLLVAVAYIAGEVTFHLKNKNWILTQSTENTWEIVKKNSKKDATKCILQ